MRYIYHIRLGYFLPHMVDQMIAQVPVQDFRM